MAVVVSNPERLPQPEAYRQVAVATGNRTVHLAGQVALEPDGSLVGPGDLAKQAEQALLNVATRVGCRGWISGRCRQADDLRGRLGAREDGRPRCWTRRAGERLGTQVLRLITLLGVAALGEPDLLIEIDAAAVLD